MRRVTILDAVFEVLRTEEQPLSAKEIHERISGRSLFAFKAVDPVAMVRAAIRKHLCTHGAVGQPVARITIVGRDRYQAT